MRTSPMIALLAVLAGPAWAQGGIPFDAQAGQRARLAAVGAGGTLVVDDGRSIRLAAIHVPPSRAVDTALDALLAHGEIGVMPVSDLVDRYGRLRAHVLAPDGRWVQAFLVARGLARVETRPDDRLGAVELLALEQEARAASRGLWRRAEYQVRSAAEAVRHIDTFQIVEDRVVGIERKGGRTSLAFGGAERALKAVIAPAARRLFRKAGLDPPGYDGKMLRVRGWIKYRNGAFIDVTHPEQIEVLDP